VVAVLVGVCGSDLTDGFWVEEAVGFDEESDF
jgi:hypothetical protein